MTNRTPDKTASLQVSRLTQYASRRFRQAMEIYQSEFPASSRLSRATVRQLLATNQYQLIIAEHDSHVIGLALIWLSSRPAFVHLDYLAIHNQEKGYGYGTTLYRWLCGHFTTLSPRATLLTLEVDEELIPFYRRSQTRVLHNVPYLYPGRRGPLPMHLMAYDRRQRQTLSQVQVQNIIRALYYGLHHRNAEDSLLLSFLSQVPRQVRLV
ncbi:MAG: GNAT family N-acetyltransferase [Candidatus Binatia bacterium]